MRKLNQSGQVNGLLISTILLALLFIGADIYAVSVYGKYKDARDNVESKVGVAVDEAKEQQKTELEKDFAEKEKNPLSTYASPAALGSVTVKYPKTWSAYVEETDNSNQINGYFHPQFVPAPAKKIKYALRLQLRNSKYADQIRTYSEKVDRNDLKASPVQISGVTGTRYEGKIEQDTTGVLIALPIRDKTIILWTESADYAADFANIILKNFTFVP